MAFDATRNLWLILWANRDEYYNDVLSLDCDHELFSFDMNPFVVVLPCRYLPSRIIVFFTVDRYWLFNDHRGVHDRVEQAAILNRTSFLSDDSWRTIRENGKFFFSANDLFARHNVTSMRLLGVACNFDLNYRNRDSGIVLTSFNLSIFVFISTGSSRVNHRVYRINLRFVMYIYR